MVLLTVYFDFASPWTYLAFSQLASLVNRLKEKYGIELDVVYKPILVGGIFNSSNPSVYELRKTMHQTPAKAIYGVKDLQCWADTYGLKILGPYDPDADKRVKPFPVNSVKALRGALFFRNISTEMFLIYCQIVFAKYWSESLDISSDKVLKNIVESKSLRQDFQEFKSFISKEDTKQEIRSYTEECIGKGGFGSPTFLVNDKTMFFGNDRLVLLERQIIMEHFGRESLVGIQSFHPSRL